MTIENPSLDDLCVWYGHKDIELDINNPYRELCCGSCNGYNYECPMYFDSVKLWYSRYMDNG